MNEDLINTTLLKEVPIFNQISDEDLKILLEHACELSFPAGKFIVNEGDPSHSLYIIKSGQVEVLKKDDDGVFKSIAVLGINDYFGEMSLFSGDKRSASIKSITNVTLLEIQHNDFLNILEKNPSISIVVIKELVKRLRITNEKFKELQNISSKIESLTEVVSSVARQTKMLALNATIEASRAGDIGKGFSVVAAEMANLANKSQHAVRTITNLTKEIKLKVKKV